MANDDQRTKESAFIYKVSPSESLSEGVVQAVSTISDSDSVARTPTDTETGQALEPLYTVIDPEALNSVFQPTDPDTTQPHGQVTFPYHGYEVTVRVNGRISVKPLNPSAGEVAD